MTGTEIAASSVMTYWYTEVSDLRSDSGSNHEPVSGQPKVRSTWIPTSPINRTLPTVRSRALVHVRTQNRLLSAKIFDDLSSALWKVELVRTRMNKAIEHQIPSTLDGMLHKLFKVKPFENQRWSLTSC